MSRWGSLVFGCAVAAASERLECMERLADDNVYAIESAQARAAGAAYLPAALAPRYVEFFQRVLESVRA